MIIAAIALALWLWPAGGLRTTNRRRPARARLPVGSNRGRVFAAALIVGAAVGLVTGILVGIAATLLSLTIGNLVVGEIGRRRRRLEMAALLSALRSLAREVRAGAQPLAAITATASTHGGPGVAVLESLSGVVTTGRLPTLANAPPASTDLLAVISERLAVGWALSARHGVPWATLIDATVADLADRVKADAGRAAQVSGPRVSGYVLAVLPILGLLLGVGMGADPVHVLLRTGIGNLMTLVGSTLTCAGLAWTSRIVRT